MKKLSQHLIRSTLGLLASAALVAQAAPAETLAAPPAGSLAARETEACERNLKTIYEAIQAYRKDHKELPNWLSDLVPRYLADRSVLICPVTTRTGHRQTYGLSDPKVNTSYAFEFSAQQVPACRWGGQSKLSMRQFKELQMAVLGGETPVLRCYQHSPRLNVGFNGRFYESEQVWENSFAHVALLKDLSPARLLERFGLAVPGSPSVSGLLEPVASEPREDLQSVVGIAVSSDGKYVYAAAYRSSAAVVFARDPQSGLLTHIQTFSDKTNLFGAVSIRLSPGGRYATVASFVSKTVALFARDATSGELTLLDLAQDKVNGVEGLNFTIRADFSPDSHFIYAIASASAALSAFRLSPEGKLQFIEANYGQDDCFRGARGLALSPDGNSVYVASATAGALVVLDRDRATGRTKIRQMFRNVSDGIHGLAGAMQVICSADGKFVYVCSGRFGGDNAIGIYKRNPDNTLTLIKELFDGQEGITGFEGGNGIATSADGLNFYALGTRSDSLLSFARDPQTGSLTYLQTLFHDSYGAHPELKSPANLALSPDGSHIYVGAEGSGAVTIFRRSTFSSAGESSQ